MLEKHCDMSGSVALVTGASSGLGAHFARVLARSGARVVLAARRADKLQSGVEEITGEGGKAVAVSMDVTSAESVEAALNEAEAAFGTVDVLINNAGVADSKRFVNVDEDSWDFIMNTNLKGVWRLASAVTRRLLAAERGGSIVNVASILGLRQGFGESTYATSKAAVVQMTKSMALELARKNIRVNALCPGYFRTELNSDYFDSEQGKSYITGTPAGRLGSLEELDGPLLLLAGSGGTFVNGVALAVDGGHLVSSL